MLHLIKTILSEICEKPGTELQVLLKISTRFESVLHPIYH